MPEAAMVYLVGAGPGDPGLVTLRGRDCLAEADVVVYDHLANDELLGHAKNARELIYVGKQADRHAMKQEEITALLIEKSRAGLTVVRLKGGDPYIFGRGGEEALELAKAGVPFEVIPGITAASGASAYAGIPLTHREFNSILTLITGHEDPDKAESAINWHALAAGGGTLAFYMGVKNLPQIVEKLIEAGRPPETAAALIRWGTLPIQQVVEGTLENIVERVEQAKLAPPCIIVVGEVVALREKLNWFEKRPLFGKTIVVTRSREQASELAEKLNTLGAQVLSFPTIRFEDPPDKEALQRCLSDIANFDWVVFTSVNAVDRFFSALNDAEGDSRALAGCKICCIGPGTADRLASQGIRADLIPKRFTSKAIFQALAEQREITGKRFLLPRADIAGRDLPEQLRAHGADVADIAAYRTLPGEPSEEVIEALRARQVDLVTFTSSSTARNFASIIKRELGKLPDAVAYVSIGPETSKAARQEGMTVRAEAQDYTIDGLVAVIVKEFGGKNL